jgi:putative CocE/NonD family hydrolase
LAAGRGSRRFNAMVEARDGLRLATDIYHADGDIVGPVVVVRTPYNKNQPAIPRIAGAWNARGYTLVVQDCRGRGDSDGDFVPYLNDPADGHDTIEWAAAQAWCNGDVITVGGSYGGMIQWLTALTRPPHLKAMVAVVSPSDPFVEWPTSGESPMSISWHRLVNGRVMQLPTEVDWMKVYEHLPLVELGEVAGFDAPHWREALGHTSRDAFWSSRRYQDKFDQLDVPVLHVSGWYDDEQVGTPLNYAGMVAGAASPRTRAAQALLMGPWGHGVNTTQKLGEVDFGAASLIDLQGYEADWADWVLGRRPERPSAPVRIFVMALDAWRDEQEWPLARTAWTDYFLHSDGNANSRLGDGVLTTEAPTRSEPADVYTSDPRRPVPFITAPESAQIGGPDDYAAVEQRGDVLCYTTEALADDLEVTGPVRLRLFASSSAVDTDFAAKLVDVHPTGFCQRLCDSIIRARYRNGPETAELIEPGRVYEYEVDMWNTSQVFRAGHRIRLELAGSAFPKYDRNLHTGEDIGTGTRMESAKDTILHDADHPSRLVLPVIPGATTAAADEERPVRHP